MGGETLLRRNLTEFFRELVQTAMSSQEVRSSEETEFYLVQLLENFAHPKGDWFERPLALDYLESFRTSAADRRAKLRRVADTSLFLSGMFMETLERTLVGPRYYVQMGRLAYGHLASASPPAGGWPFAELSHRFEEFVQVLSEISFNELFPGDSRLVRTYSRWLLTGSERDRLWLTRQGLIPMPDSGRKH